MAAHLSWIGDSWLALGEPAAARVSWRQAQDVVDTLPPHVLALPDVVELADDLKSKVKMNCIANSV